MNKFFNAIKNRYVVYALIVFIYLVGVVGANILDSILVDAGECFSVAWNVLVAWGIIRYFQNTWNMRLSKTRFFNLYMLLGLLVILVNFICYIGPSDFHEPAHRYIVVFIATFSTALAEQSVLSAFSHETFKGDKPKMHDYQVVIVVGVLLLFSFFKEFLSSYFVNLVNHTVDVNALISTSEFWIPILNHVVLAVAFGFFLFSIYRKTNLTTCVIIMVLFYLLQDFTKLSVSATYLPDTVARIILLVNITIMIGCGLFFTLYKKKLPEQLEYVPETGSTNQDKENEKTSQ